MRRLVAACAVVSIAVVGCSQATMLPRKAIELNQAGAQAFAAGHLEVAEARIALALEYNPKFTEAWVNLGLIYEAEGNFVMARKDFVKARDLNPDLPIVHHALGQLDEREGSLPEAEHNYRQALKVDPGFAPARINLGRLLYARGAFDDAREQFLRLTQVAPEQSIGWSGLCESLLKLGRQPEAEDVLNHVGRAFDDDPNIAILRGRILLLHRHYLEAIAELQPVSVSDDPHRAAAALAWMALARLGTGDGDAAQAEADRAVALDGDDPLTHYVRRAVQEARSAAGRASNTESTQPNHVSGR
jgi:tetratricopeptide (TPR) repeat protein